MAISKTDFINYTRCSRYSALEEIKKEKLDADITYQEYKDIELQECIKELLDNMFEDEEYTEDKTKKMNAQAEALMPYYKQVEIEAGTLVNKYFKGKSTYASSTFNQECFEFNKNGIKYLCYVDIYNENESGINIIEVKATTSNKYIKLEAGHKKCDKFSIFNFDKETNTYILKDELNNYPIEDEMPIETYARLRNKLFDRYSDVGSYVYDLAVQRYIIENDYKETKLESKLKDIHYYLAVLNFNYVFDGTMIKVKQFIIQIKMIMK